MTHSELVAAARGRKTVVARVRCSAEVIKIRGKVTALYDKYDTQGVARPCVEVAEETSRSVYHCAPEDVLEVVGEAEDRARAVAADALEYVVLGRVGAEEFRVVAQRGGAKVGVYRGYLDEKSDVMRLYIKESYDRSIPGKAVVSISALGGRV
jgi:hypothetical protein